MASLLIHIKSKMLLPRDPDSVAGELDDPREELVQRLLEHEKFKNAAQMLLQKQQLEDAVVTNPSMKEFKDAEGTEPELAADVVDLVKVFQEILDRARTRPILQVDEETVTIGQMVEYFRRRLLMEDRPIRLKRLLQHVTTRHALIASFLALLELVRLQAILLRQDRVFGDILIKKHAMFDTVMGEGAMVRDDWKIISTMSIKAKLEALVYAAEDPITLDQMAALLKDDLLALKEVPAPVPHPEQADEHLGAVEGDSGGRPCHRTIAG